MTAKWSVTRSKSILMLSKINLLFIVLSLFLTLVCNGQNEKTDDSFLSISPIITSDNSVNKLIISALDSFLQSKNNSLSENTFWLQSDFQKYVYPFVDIYNIEQSKYGKDFYKPTLMEIVSTENQNQKILKIAFLGHNPETNENLIKAVYNIIANVEGDNIMFSRYLDFATKTWTKQKSGSINYIISPNKNVNKQEIDNQRNEVHKLCDFFKIAPISITYYSCVNPKELFEIKGFDYHPMMYVDKSGGLADLGNIIFSGNNSEIYTHEIVHIYTTTIYTKIDKFLDEGIATYIAGSGKQDYKWHREKLRKFIAENPEHDFKNHIDPYERFYFEKETSIPYLTAALICERTNRIYGKEKLLQLLKSEHELWKILRNVGLTKENINEELLNELKREVMPIW